MEIPISQLHTLSQEWGAWGRLSNKQQHVSAVKEDDECVF